MTYNLYGIRSEELIGRRSSYIVLAIVYEWQTKDKRPQRSNVNTKNLEQNSQYLWNKLFSGRSVWVLQEIIGRWTQHFTKIDQFVFGTPWLLDSLCKHWFASSVWNFCRRVAEVPPRKTSSEAKSKEKRMFSQANQKGYWTYIMFTCNFGNYWCKSSNITCKWQSLVSEVYQCHLNIWRFVHQRNISQQNVLVCPDMHRSICHVWLLCLTAVELQVS